MAPAAQPSDRSEADFLATLEKLEAKCFCVEPFTEEHVPIVMECCKQVVGAECLKKWIKTKAANKNKCPLCRGVLFKKVPRARATNSTTNATPDAPASLPTAVPSPYRSINTLRHMAPWFPDHSPPTLFTYSPPRYPSTPEMYFAPPPRLYLPTPSRIPVGMPTSRHHTEEEPALQSMPTIPTPGPRRFESDDPFHPRIAVPTELILQLAVATPSYLGEAKNLWASLLSHPHFFRNLWTEVQAKVESMKNSGASVEDIRLATKLPQLSDFVQEIFTHEHAFGECEGREQILLNCMYHLERLARVRVQEPGVVLTEEQAHAIIATEQLFTCVELMMNTAYLVDQPTHLTSDIFTAIISAMYSWYSRNADEWFSARNFYDFPKLFSHSRRAYPLAQRLISVLLLSKPPQTIKSVLRERERDESNDLAINKMADILRRELGPTDGQLERLESTSDETLKSYWQRVGEPRRLEDNC